MTIKLTCTISVIIISCIQKSLNSSISSFFQCNFLRSFSEDSRECLENPWPIAVQPGAPAQPALQRILSRVEMGSRVARLPSSIEKGRRIAHLDVKRRVKELVRPTPAARQPSARDVCMLNSPQAAQLENRPFDAIR